MNQTAELLKTWEDGGVWWYTVEQYPYAAADQYVTYGPFATLDAAAHDWGERKRSER